MVAIFAMIVLTVWDRRTAWLADLRWWWGLVIVLAIVGPWAGAVTVATDGGFWSQAVGSDLAPKLAGGQESHGAPPGYHLLLTPLLAFPMTLLLPAAAVTAWRHRGEPGVRFALAWLVPAWIVFEALPTKLPHYLMPAYGGLAWLAARSLAEPIGAAARWLGAGLLAVMGLVLAAAVFYLLSLYGDASDAWAATLAGGLLAAAGLVGAYLMVRDAPQAAVLSSLALAILGHAALAAALAPAPRAPVALRSRGTGHGPGPPAAPPGGGRRTGGGGGLRRTQLGLRPRHPHGAGWPGRGRPGGRGGPPRYRRTARGTGVPRGPQGPGGLGRPCRARRRHKLFEG